MSAQRELFGEKAIEVATMLGDSVVDVKHCMDPHGGKVTPRTWSMLASGALCLLLSAGAFVVSVKTAAYNHGAQNYWTHVAHKPDGAFRGVVLSTGYDWLAFGGFLLGLVTIAVGLYRARKEKQDPTYKIGTAPDVRLAVEGAPAPSFAMVAPKGDDFVFNYGVGMTGDMVVDGKATPLAELAASGMARPSTTAVGAFELPIPTNGRIRAAIGMTSFQVTTVAKPATQAAPLFAASSRTLSYFAGSLGAHLALVLLLSQIPMEDSSTSFDLASLEPTDISSNNHMSEDTPPTPVEDDASSDGAGKESSGKSMALEEGQAGKPTANRIGHMRVANNNAPDQIAQSRDEIVERAIHEGILGSARLHDTSLFSNLASQSEITSGPDSTNTWGAIYGADEGEGYGSFGYGRHGFGPGGGCYGTDCGSIGTPTGYGQIGQGNFPGSGWDVGTGGRFPMKTHKSNPPPGPTIGEAKAVGGLDKAIIRRYIKRNINKISYCYEKQLLAHPTIEGTVKIQFFIAPDGSVTSSNGDGFNSEVAGCVASVIGAIEFPRPDGGGGVTVNYPFTFHAAGQGTGQ
jgi:hypothetical protein